jgi:hypothetical protein
MNRYVAQGLLNDMRSGKTVIYVGDNQKQAREAFLQCCERRQDGETVRRGDEQISHPGGGRVRFLSHRTLRGFRGDVVFADYPIGLDDYPMLAITARDGELLRL